MFLLHQERIIDPSGKNRLPAMYSHRSDTTGGGLMAYAPSFPDIFHRAATYVDKILKGAKPGELPIEQPTKIEFVVNLKTAKTLDRAFPQSALLRADELIQ